MQLLSNPARVAADPLFGRAHIFEMVLSGKAVADYVLHSASGIRTGNTGCADFTLRATYDPTLMHSFPPFHYVALKDPILSIGGMKHFKVTAKTMYVAVRSSFAYLEYADVDLMRIALSINTFFLDHVLGPLPGTVEVQPDVILEGSYQGEPAEFSLASVQNQIFLGVSETDGSPVPERQR
jgi:hypothetical protein